MKTYPQQPGEHYYSQQKYPYEAEQGAEERYGDAYDAQREPQSSSYPQGAAYDQQADGNYAEQQQRYYYEQQQQQMQQQQYYDRRMNDRRAQPDEEYREMFLMNLFLSGYEQRHGFGRRKEDYDKWLH
ncbi:hypothetical protein HNQ59_002746 [Chitinivorax tropicus]|uniref:Uncharacterized protein n=1 Tax=Chitinivorax tropicus TaxID=714531 RepID=A0A840MJS1_9PROT|nr:hypothetical protein [Chitinivorax tropicus]MBB5019444.1 hypothetical protein [Chitinivorax tropicus]